MNQRLILIPVCLSQGEIRQNTVTLVEAWVNLDALHAHLKTPHMATYREAVKDYVQNVRLQVLEPVYGMVWVDRPLEHKN